MLFCAYRAYANVKLVSERVHYWGMSVLSQLLDFYSVGSEM